MIWCLVYVFYVFLMGWVGRGGGRGIGIDFCNFFDHGSQFLICIENHSEFVCSKKYPHVIYNLNATA